MKLIQPIAIAAGTPTFDLISLSVDFIAEVYAYDGGLSEEPTTLFYSDVPEDDYDLWASGSYDAGDTVIYDHGVYEALSTTTDQPDVGAAKETPTWLRISATNRWKMFDGQIAPPTSQGGGITIAIDPGEVVNALAAFGLKGSEMTITMTDPVEGVVYTRAVPLIDNSAIIDWYAYFFEPIVYVTDLVVDDLPAYPGAIIDIAIFAGEETAEVGELVAGRVQTIGDALFGTSVGIQSYSVTSEDQFGGITIVPRGFARRVEYAFSLPTSQVARVQNLLASLRDTPIVFIGDPSRGETILYGFAKDFRIVLSDWSTSDCSLEARGLTQ